MKNTDNGLLLFKTNYSESSLILTFYTQSSGLSKYIYKGGKKKKTPFLVFGHYEISSFKRPESDLGIINSLTIATPYLSTSSHPIKVLISYFISDVLKQTLREEQADQQLFTFLLKLAEELNNTTNLKSFPLEFLANLIAQLGVSPTTIEHATGFNMEEGVFLSSGNGAITKDEKMASYLNDLFTTLKAPERNLDKEALEILLSYMRIHLPSFDNSRSISIIRDVIYD